jgi:Na+/H+ antiporter NhaD/arsenite permease-like protein
VPPAFAGLLITWLVIWIQWRGCWRAATTTSLPVDPGSLPFDRWQTLKGILVLVAVILAFLFAPWPREAVALAGAGMLLLSRRMASQSGWSTGTSSSCSSGCSC